MPDATTHGDHALYATDAGKVEWLAVPDDIEQTRHGLKKKRLEFARDVEELADEAGVEVVAAVMSGSVVDAVVGHRE